MVPLGCANVVVVPLFPTLAVIEGRSVVDVGIVADETVVVASVEVGVLVVQLPPFMFVVCVKADVTVGN